MGRSNRKHCRKLAYKSKSAARTALKEYRHIGVKRFYRCQYCIGSVYHLTSESR